MERHDDHAGATGPRPALSSRLLSAPVRPAVVWAGRAAALVVFVAVVVLRGGPLSAQNDAQVVTRPTTAISHGQWRLAEEEAQAADPPGYPLLAAPLVAALRPVVGSPTWCSDRALPPVIARSPQASFYRALLHRCADQRPHQRGALPPWWRSQAVLGVVAWLVLLAGVQLLLRAARRQPTVAEVVAALGLAAIPAGSDALVVSFHPQDLLTVGLVCMALSQALRRRWVMVGALLGLAVVSKQFAVLALPAVLAAAPDRRARAVVVGAAGAVALVVVAPFWLADSSATWRALSGTYVRGIGVVRSSTVIGQLGIGQPLKLKLARDLALALSAGLGGAAWWWARDRLRAPVPLIGLALAGMAARLVFEVSILEYYLLATAVLLLVVELAAGRPPVACALWVVATRYGVLRLPSVVGPGWVAAAMLVASLAAVVFGLAHVREQRSRAGHDGVVARAHAPCPEPT